MPVSPTSSTPQSAPSAVPANPKGDISSQDTFMKLLVAELKHQDPMDPMQSRDMVAQLAQLSSVQKLSTIDEKLGALRGDTITGSSIQTAGLIGKTVTAQTNRLTVNSVGKPVGSFKLARPAENVKVEVLDASGQSVRVIDLGKQGGGARTFSWDGRDFGNRRVPNGAYHFNVSASDEQGRPVDTSTEVSGRVSEVTYTNGSPELVVGGVHVGLLDVSTVHEEVAR